jgi:hypothetical protein
MHLRTIRRRPALIAAAALLAIGASAGVAIAVPSGSFGQGQVRMDNRGETGVFNTNMVAWQTLPNSQVPLAIPDQTRVVNARFTAGSTCFGPAGEWCRTRIVVEDPAGVITELDPVDGINYHWDSAAPGTGNVDREGHAMERSRRLAPGNYVLRVEWSVSNANTLFTLGHWHLAVETSV